MREYTTIPLMTEWGLDHLVIEPSEFGDPYSVTLVLPPCVLAAGKLHLPRRMFSDDLELPLPQVP